MRRHSQHPHRSLRDIGNWEVRFIFLVSDMVICRSYLPDGRELEDKLGGESGIGCEEAGRGESYREKRVGEGWCWLLWVTNRDVLHLPTRSSSNIEKKVYHVYPFPAGAKDLALWGHRVVDPFLPSHRPFEKAEASPARARACSLACTIIFPYSVLELDEAISCPV